MFSIQIQLEREKETIFLSSKLRCKWGNSFCTLSDRNSSSTSKRNLTSNLLDPNQIRSTYATPTKCMGDRIFNLLGLEPKLIKLEFIIYLPKLKVQQMDDEKWLISVYLPENGAIKGAILV